uniref:Similar to n=1 Tax=Steinernema glaseri TaxID=37863 RepID=A0A1I7YAP4_9BILA
MTTMFERGCPGGNGVPQDPVVDTSDEMEEIRELLYALINEEFPSGVRSDYLQRVYEQKYSEVSLGPKLPANWLEQVEHSEEFELQRRGHLILVYTRQRDVPEPIDVTQIVAPLKSTALNLNASHAKTTIASSQACKLYKASLSAFGTATPCTVAWASDAFDKFAISPQEDILHGVWNLKVAMKEHFSDSAFDEASADAIPQPGNLYAVKEKDFWYRVEVLV